MSPVSTGNQAPSKPTYWQRLRWRRPAIDIVRIGRQAIELWTDRQAPSQPGLQLAYRHGFLPSANDTSLDVMVSTFFAHIAPQHGLRNLDVIIESAWLPCSFLALPDQRIWSQAQLQALALHRLNHLYAARSHNWVIQSTYLPGDKNTLVYGCPAELLAAIQRAAKTTPITIKSVQPAFAWGWDRLLASGQQRSLQGWLVWPEQDRSILCWYEHGRLYTMNNSGPPLTQVNILQTYIQQEMLRVGLADPNALIHLPYWESHMAALVVNAHKQGLAIQGYPLIKQRRGAYLGGPP